MPRLTTKGAASAQGFGELNALAQVANYIEDVFGTYLYQGNSGNITVTNGIDLAGKGGLVWIKDRTQAFFHALWDTARGALNSLASNRTDQAYAEVYGVTAFNANGFSMNASSNTNNSGDNFASWTFRKQPKFFDIVTYTGNGANRTIAHNLGSVPGCIIVKRTDTSGAWAVYHRSLANTDYLVLNTTAASATGATYWNSTTATSSVFSLGTATDVNANGGTYVAYLFAHDAGGFGLTGTDNVISCGSFTGANTIVNLGYEPQWLLMKQASTTGDWFLVDNMRGFPDLSSSTQTLFANTSAAEGTFNIARPTSTGFINGGNGGTIIYIAIRRGPMRVPTSGTSVFSPITYSGLIPGSGNVTNTSGFPIDLIWARRRNTTVNFGASNSSTGVLPRLTGGFSTGLTTAATPIMATVSTDAEATQNTGIYRASNTGFTITGDAGGLAVDTGSGETYIAECFRRAPGFFDVVCYTGTGADPISITHNLGVTPELLIVKSRSNTSNWLVWSAAVSPNYYTALLNTTQAFQNDIGAGRPQNWTSTTFQAFATVNTAYSTNTSGYTYVAYLFASCPGVSKVFSYTGNGTSQTINCGFTAGARFVLVKRTDSTGNWLVVDTARGLVAAGDPTLYLNSTAAEVTGVDWIDPDPSGFIVNQEATMNANVLNATYIGLAVA